MAQSAGIYRVGLGGWEHEVFDEVFYPAPALTSTEKLAYYSRFLPTVEVRATFWDETLSGSDAAAWADSVSGNPGFEFQVKLHASLTHNVGKPPLSDVSRNTRELLQELSRRGRLGSLLIQFPYAFTNTSANRYHIVRLAELFAGFPAHVEFRHESWHHAGLLSFLRENGLGVVSADIPRIRHYMPFITGVSGPAAYLRLHGRNEKGWLLDGYDARYDYLYNARETRELEKRLLALSSASSRVTVIANNTTGGKAVPLAFQLLSSLQNGRPVRIPDAALRAFPGLRSIALAEDAGESLISREPLHRAV